MSVAANYVTITGTTQSRRATLKVNFKVFQTTPVMQTRISTLSTFLSASGSTGFMGKLNANMITAGITGLSVTSIAGVVVEQPKPTLVIPPLVIMPTKGNATQSNRRNEHAEPPRPPRSSPLSCRSPQA